jgi:hypothetical protein
MCDEVLPAVDFAGIVHSEDVGVVERRGHSCLALKPMARGRIRDMRIQKFQCDHAVESGIVCAVDLAHTTFAKERLDLIGAQPRAWRKRGVLCRIMKPLVWWVWRHRVGIIMPEALTRRR